MSRTYRKRKALQKTFTSPDWVLIESGYDYKWLQKYSLYGSYVSIKFNRNSIEGKKRLAKYHSDSGTHEFKEPGPRLYKNLCTIRPYRRKYKEECRRCLFDNEYDIILEKIVYEYWT